MVVWTRQQQAVVAILPKFSAALSILGSGWIVTEITTHKGHHVTITGPNSRESAEQRRKQAKMQHPYHRLLLGMCIYDILEAVWNFQSTWPIPESPSRIWSTGAQGTCSAQGFFLMLAIAVPIYNSSLAVYYMLVIVFRFTEKTLVTRVEPMMHLIAGGFAFGTSITMLAMGYYNDANLWCWIAPYPAGCLDSWRFGYPPENTSPCTRGDLAWIYRWAFYFAPLWFCILVATCCTIIVYCKVYQNEKRSLRYRQPDTSNSALFPQSIALRQSIGGGELQSTSERRSTVSDNRSVEEEISLVQRQLLSIAQAEEEEDDVMAGDRSTTLAPVPLKEPDLIPRAHSTSEGSAELSTCKNEMDNVDRRKDFGKQSSTLSQSVQAIRQWQERHSENIKNNPRTAQVAQQSFWYLLTFYLCHVWSTSNRIYQQRNNTTLYPLTVIHSFFDPLHGFLNFLVYQRPRYLIVRKKYPDIGRWGAIRTVLYFSFQQSKSAIAEKRHSERNTINGVGQIASRQPVTSRRRILSATTEQTHSSQSPGPSEDLSVEKNRSKREAMRSSNPFTIEEADEGDDDAKSTENQPNINPLSVLYHTITTNNDNDNREGNHCPADHSDIDPHQHIRQVADPNDCDKDAENDYSAVNRGDDFETSDVKSDADVRSYETSVVLEGEVDSEKTMDEAKITSVPPQL